jgi:hypothetical protein
MRGRISPARPGKKKSALGVKGVGSRLISTTLAPVRRAAPGREAAGWTTAEVPTTNIT